MELCAICGFEGGRYKGRYTAEGVTHIGPGIGLSKIMGGLALAMDCMGAHVTLVTLIDV